MKHKEFEELKSDPNIMPEDVANFCLYEGEMNDNMKFTAICDLIVCCERSASKEQEIENRKLREALEALAGAVRNLDTKSMLRTTVVERLVKYVRLAESVLNKK